MKNDQQNVRELTEAETLQIGGGKNGGGSQPTWPEEKVSSLAEVEIRTPQE